MYLTLTILELEYILLLDLAIYFIRIRADYAVNAVDNKDVLRIRTGATGLHGHYFNWQPNSDLTKWLRVSDTNKSVHTNLINNIPDIYAIFLELVQ